MSQSVKKEQEEEGGFQKKNWLLVHEWSTPLRKYLEVTWGPDY